MANPSEPKAFGSGQVVDLEDTEYQQLKGVFLEVVDLAPDQQQARLNFLVPDDAVLRGRVKRLLRLYTDGDWLPPPPSGRFPQLQAGDVFANRFEVIRPIGQGGMGDVYKVHDRHLGERVALKTLRPDFIDIPKTAQFFRDEVLHARKISHRNICRIFDLHIDPKRKDALAFTMELLDGETLRAGMDRDGQLSTKAALPLVKQMAEGLDALHAEGIVHCDFKPENVIIVKTEDGSECVKITDFGISRKVTPEDSGLYSEHPGTLDYMAPEVEKGKKPTPAADLFAFGVVMHEMLTGVRRPLLAGVKVDARWANAIRRCITPDPKERLRSAGRALALLEESRFVDLGLAVATVVLAVLAMIPWPQPLPGDKHVAVLPISTLVPDEELGQVAGGLTREITLRLAQYEAMEGTLTVVPPGEVVRFEVDEPAEALEYFDANFVVEGVLSRQDDRVQLVLSLIDTKEAELVETAVIPESYSRLMNLQNSAVSRLAAIIDARPLPHLPGGIPYAEPGAFIYYYLGIDRLREGSDSLEDINAAEELFNQSLAANPPHAGSHAGLARVFWYRYQITRDAVWVEQAQDSARKALELDPNLAEAHITMAQVLSGTGKQEQALVHIEKARPFATSNPDVYKIQSDVEKQLGRFAEAESSILAAIARRPGDWELYKKKGQILMKLSRWDDAIRSFEQVIRLDPDNAQGLSNLGVALYNAGRIAEAQQQFEAVLRQERRPPALSNLGTILFEQKKYSEAAVLFAEAASLEPHRFLLWGNLGAAYQWGGDPRQREAYKKALDCLASEVQINPKPRYFPFIALYEVQLGHANRAQTAIRQSLQELQNLSADDISRIAHAYEVLGDRTKAIEFLLQAIQQGLALSEVERMPRFENLLRADEWKTAYAQYEPQG